MTIPKNIDTLREGNTTEATFHLQCYVLDALQTEMIKNYWSEEQSVPAPLLIDIMILSYFIHFKLDGFELPEFMNYKYRGSIIARWPRFVFVLEKKPEIFIDAHTGIVVKQVGWVKKINWLPIVNEINRIADGGSKAEFLSAQEIWERWSFDYYYVWPGRDRKYRDDLTKLLKEKPTWD